MTDTPERLVCQWCGRTLTPARATWWDSRPQCPDPIRCTPPTRRQEQK